jgi:excinuclease UvrABC ATPase subunit
MDELDLDGREEKATEVPRERAEDYLKKTLSDLTDELVRKVEEEEVSSPQFSWRYTCPRCSRELEGAARRFSQREGPCHRCGGVTKEQCLLRPGPRGGERGRDLPPGDGEV